MTTQLHHLMDAAADSNMPDGLAHAALAGARHRRRNRFAVLGAVASVGAAFLAVVVVVQPITSTDSGLESPAAIGVLPNTLPTADGLPTLASAPMAAASGAYIVEGRVVLINAATREAVITSAEPGDFPPSLSGTSAARSSTPHWSSVQLSPDGRFLLMIAEPEHGQNLGRLPVYLLDVRSGELNRMHNITIPVVSGDEVLAGRQTIAWSPRSDGFVCVCSSEDPQRPIYRGVSVKPEIHYWPLGHTEGHLLQVAWGVDVVALQFREHGGTWMTVGGDPLGWGERLAMATESPYLLAARTGTGTRQEPGDHLAAGATPQGLVEYRVQRVGQPAATTLTLNGELAAVGATADGFTVSLYPAMTRTAASSNASPIDVVFVDLAGQPTPLTQLPPGTSSPSFAANLIQAPS
ncbi:MAG TPA: hypothetical protein VMT88_08540 [Actinomycetes bacterium]|nr:hypothetical protein [Actinomycetes bacterium]